VKPPDDSTHRLPNASLRRSVRSYVLAPFGPTKGVSLNVKAAHGGTTSLGTSPLADLYVDDPSVSRRHALLSVDDAGLRIVDQESTNGTTINGLRIRDAVVGGGEVVLFGIAGFSVLPGPTELAPALPFAARFGKLIGQSEAMRALYPLLKRLASSTVPVLIQGETGSGKEVVAEALHDASPRASQPFVVFDCTTVSPALLESTLFGHEKGAFTGASAMRRGVFEQADGGTLFIDEIGDLDLPLQARLLRAAERQEVQRVGGSAWLKVDVRIVSATRRDLEREVQAGRFRDDLYFRLAVARVDIPPLRAREGDIDLLARHFWSRNGGRPEDLLPATLAHFSDREWPGNVRELANVIAQHVALGDLAGVRPGPLSARSATADGSSPDSLPPSALEARSEASASFPGDTIGRVIAEGLSFHVARERLLAEFHQRYTATLLGRYGGNISKAAAASGVARRYFYVLKRGGTE
jgi:two-component system, NtrC family, response regulator HydG